MGLSDDEDEADVLGIEPGSGNESGSYDEMNLDFDLPPPHFHQHTRLVVALRPRGGGL